MNLPDSEDELIDILEILDVSVGGHVTVISAAEWIMTDECYIYTVMDPNGVGTKKYLTYNELIFDYTTSADQYYVRFWFPTVVTKTEFSDKTLIEEILSTDFNSN